MVITKETFAKALELCSKARLKQEKRLQVQAKQINDMQANSLLLTCMQANRESGKCITVKLQDYGNSIRK